MTHNSKHIPMNRQHSKKTLNSDGDHETEQKDTKRCTKGTEVE
jgi:hypothetical protein